MNFMFEWQELYLTRSLRSLVRYSSCHEIYLFTLFIIYFLLYKRAVFDDFPKFSDHFPKISEDFPKLFRRPDERFRTFSEHFRRFSEDYQRLPKIAKDNQRRSEDVSIIH